MDNNFEINDLVMCIDDSIKPGMEQFVAENYPNWVRHKEQYHIREFVDNNGIVTGVLLEELHNPEIYITLLGELREGAFRLNRFIKIQSVTKTEVTEEELTKPFEVFEITIN